MNQCYIQSNSLRKKHARKRIRIHKKIYIFFIVYTLHCAKFVLLKKYKYCIQISFTAFYSHFKSKLNYSATVVSITGLSISVSSSSSSVLRSLVLSPANISTSPAFVSFISGSLSNKLTSS